MMPGNLHTMKYALTLFLAFVVGVLHAQESASISGRVVDKNSAEPLSYVSIRLKNSSAGTISNSDGMFSIHVTANYGNDTLQFSRMGYESKEIAVRSLVEKNSVIELATSFIYLKEVIVEDSLTAKEILRRAYKRLAVNYPSTPFRLEGFYREIQKADSQYVSLIEAATVIYSDGFASRSKDKYWLRQLRKTIGYDNPYVPFWDNTNLLSAFVGQNFVKYKKRSLLKYDHAIRREDTSIDGVRVYIVVVSERADFWPNTLYIRCDDYAIIRVEEHYNSEVDAARSWKVENNPLVMASPKAKELQVNFGLYQGKYYPENFLMKFRAIYKDSMTGKELLDFQIDQQFIITDRATVNSHKPPPEEFMDERVSLKKLSTSYDPDFWKTYTILEETPLDASIRADLERQMKLEEQFRK
jgi:hypothetical protein